MDTLTQYITLYNEHAAEIDAHAPVVFNHRRVDALRHLGMLALPKKGDETYPALSVDDMFAPDFGVNVNRVNFPVDTSATFHCGVPNISTLLALVVNDTFTATDTLLRNLPDGVELMSLAKAATLKPEFVERYLGHLAPLTDTVVALNTLLLQDGVLVHVQKGVHLERPLQIVNIFNAAAPFMGIRRVLIVIDDDASASMLTCDHSQINDMQYLSNQVVEIYLGANARLDYYDLEESSEHTSRYSALFARQEQGSVLSINGTTLVAGTTRNNYNIDIIGDHADTSIAAMAIGADKQVIDNMTNIRHLSKGSTSRQMFKYVLDGQSQGSFFGKILVDEKATRTNAYQTNRNVLASTDARMYTRPQLEIYCDDVKCSHGATVGQLDANALFYMQSRGIPEHEARLMLMQAFMADVIDTVCIPALKVRLQQLVESRLAGHHTLCADCAVQSPTSPKE